MWKSLSVQIFEERFQKKQYSSNSQDTLTNVKRKPRVDDHHVVTDIYYLNDAQVLNIKITAAKRTVLKDLKDMEFFLSKLSLITGVRQKLYERHFYHSQYRFNKLSSFQI